ncbi:MAG: radical SAM protein [Candidatus Sumerlaeia bacterium]|nr:radical SAM protein [Candidatus Sumerlaeia bacterium]
MLETTHLVEAELAEESPLSVVEHLHIEMGYQCNYRCTFCYQVDFSAKQNMIDVVWREKLRPVYPTIKSAFLQGGEPTIMKNCIGFRDLMVEEYPHVRLGVVTNGLRFDETWAQIMLDHGYLVQFSLNGRSKEVYDRTMKFGQYDQVMTNVERLLDMRRTQGRTADVQVAVSYVAVPENVCELADFIHFAADVGIDEVKIFCDQVLSAASSDTAGTMREIARAYEAIAARPQVKVVGLESFELLYRTKHGLMREDPSAAERCKCSRAVDLCQIPWTQVYVKHKGELTFCCMTWRNVGNLLEDDIATLWNGPKARQFRRDMLKDRFTFCSPTCLSNRRPDYGPLWQARKLAYQAVEDPDLIWKKARNKVERLFEYRRKDLAVDGQYDSVQPKKKPRATG